MFSKNCAAPSTHAARCGRSGATYLYVSSVNEQSDPHSSVAHPDADTRRSASRSRI
jgi:hypothetical protein